MLLSDYLFVLGKLKFSTQPHYPLSQTSTAGQAGYQLMHFWDDTSQLFPRMFDWLFQASAFLLIISTMQPQLQDPEAMKIATQLQQQHASRSRPTPDQGSNPLTYLLLQVLPPSKGTPHNPARCPEKLRAHLSVREQKSSLLAILKVFLCFSTKVSSVQHIFF